ncbi:hypothetical protein BBJ28_00014131, partial [Nothophytophthora sp. Chile5]
MSFVEMLTAASPSPSQWVAPPAASWTREEISIIQELFLSDEKAIQIRDISISGKQEQEPLSAVAPNQDATQLLLSPIGADDSFLQQFIVDEKDAMAAFFLEAIDPFQNVPVSSVEDKKSQEVVTVTPAPGPSDGRPVEQVIAKLRAKVEALNRVYYSRCMNKSADETMGEADETSINKVKLMLALEKLQRVIQGLSKENAQLKSDTTSCLQRSALLLQEGEDANSVLEKISEAVDEPTCAAAMKEGMDVALNCSMEGEVLKDLQDDNGWGYKSVVTKDGAFSYTLKKEYPKDVDMLETMKKTWTNVSSSEDFSCLYYGSIKAQVVKKVDKETVIMYDVTNHDSTRVDRVLAVLFRVKLPNGYLLGARSINASPAGVAAALSETSDGLRLMDSTTWQRYERNDDGGFSVVSGGQLSYPSRADVDFMAVEILCLHLRWENRVVGSQLSIAKLASNGPASSMHAQKFDVNWQKVWPDRMPVILRDLAPTNPFNPRNLWPEEQEEDAAAADANPASGKKPIKEDKKGGGKVKKADLIRMQLAKDKAQKQSKVDEEKLANVKKSMNLLKMKMV